MIKSVLGDRLDGWIHALFPFLFRWRMNPNVLTVLGTLLSLVGALSFSMGYFVAAGVMILVGGFFDLVDGVVARSLSTVIGTTPILTPSRNFRSSQLNL